jgi:hypothetical protein
VRSGTSSWNHSSGRSLSRDVTHELESGLQLRSITVDSAPTGNNGTYQAGLVDGSSKDEVLQASDQQASGLKRYAQPLQASNNFSMRLAIAAPQGAMLTAGNYVSTVTVDCLSPI